MVETIDDDIEKNEPPNMPVKIGNFSFAHLVDSGNACIILDRSLATLVFDSNPQAIRVKEMNIRQLRKFSNESIQMEGKIRISITGKGWHIPAVDANS